MSGSATRRVAGLDTMDASELAAMKEMQEADGAPPPDELQPSAESPDPAPAAEEIPETEETTEGAPAKQPRRDAKVPHAALHEERVKRQNTEAKLRETETRHAAELARTQERLSLIAAAVTEATKPAPAAAAAPEPIPDFDENPAGFIKASHAAHQRELAELRAMLGQHGQTFQQQQIQQQQIAAINDLSNWAQSQANAKAAEDPTYIDAENHLITLRRAELEAMGYDSSQHGQIIRNEALQMAQASRQQGANYAERILNLAKLRGFTPKASDPAPAADTSAVELPRANAQERGRDMALSLGSAGGAPRGPLSVEQILRLDDKAFDKMLTSAKKGGIDAMRQLFGS